MPGRPFSKSKRIEALRKQLAAILRELRQEAPDLHFRPDAPAHCAKSPVRSHWRDSLGVTAQAVLATGDLAYKLAQLANGGDEKCGGLDEADDRLASDVLDLLEIENQSDYEKRRFAARDRLIRIAAPARIWQLANEYSGDAGEKPLKNERFCRWAVERVRSERHENDEKVLASPGPQHEGHPVAPSSSRRP